MWLGSKLTWWKSLEVSGSHGGAKQQQRVFVVVGSCWEPLGAIGSHWEPLGVIRSRGSQLPNQSTLAGFGGAIAIDIDMGAEGGSEGGHDKVRKTDDGLGTLNTDEIKRIVSVQIL